MTTHPAEWDIVPIASGGTGALQDLPFNAPLYYHDKGGNGSREIVVNKEIFHSNDPNSHVLHDTWFSTSTGTRKIQGAATGYPLYYPPGSSTLYPVPELNLEL